MWATPGAQLVRWRNKRPEAAVAGTKEYPVEPFRDPTEGAKARRRDLLTRRRDDLATMPHFIRRVFVKRSARAAAGAVLFAGGALIAATAMSLRLTDWFAGVLPGPTP